MVSSTASGTAAHVEQQLLQMARELLRDLGREDAAVRVSLEASIERDLGIDSLDLLELVMRCEARFGIDLGDGAAGRATTLGDWARLIAETEPTPAYPAGYKIRQPRRRAPPAPHTALTFHDVLRRQAEYDADRVHIHLLEKDSGRDISYGALLQAATQAAAGLQALGLERGQTVAIMLPHSVEFFHAFFAVLLAGGIAVPIYPPVRPDQIEDYVLRQVRVLRHADIRFLITFDRVKVVSRLIRLRLPSRAEVVTVPALRDAGTGLRLKSVDPAEYALVQYTSGSTGDPKGVALTHANLLANVRAIGEAVHVSPEDSVVSWTPLFSDLGLVGTWLFSLYHATPLTVISPLDFLNRPERWLWAIHHSRGTLSAGPNFGYEMCARKAASFALDGLDLRSWRVAVNAGEAVLPATLDRFTERFAPYGFRRECFVTAYGLAENTVALAIPAPGQAPRVDSIDREMFERTGRAEPAGGENVLRYVSSGPPLPGHDVCIVDEMGAPLPERTQGRLLFRGPSRTNGYLNNREATAEAMLPGGWMDSGDLAYLAGGEIYFTGRRKECIIHEGRNLSPHDIEVALADVPGVQAGGVAAIGVPDPQAGTERIVVIAESMAYREADLRHVKMRVEHRLREAFALTAEVELVPPGSVPRTSNGKIRRSAARQKYLDGKLRARRRPLWAQIANLWRGALLPGAARAAWSAGESLREWSRVAGEVGTCLGAGVLARIGILSGLHAAARKLAGAPVGVFTKPGVYVVNRASAADIWALVAMSGGRCAFSGDAALLDLRGSAQWALAPLVMPAAEALAQRRPVVVMPESAAERLAARCRYRLDPFKVAIATGTAMTPVALAHVNGELRAIAGEPLLPGDGETAAVLRERTRAAIVTLSEGGAHA